MEEFLRPNSIVWFERIIIVTILLGIANSWLVWPQLISQASPAYVLTIQAITLGILLGLTLLISRRRSRVAKWISIALFVVGLPVFLNGGNPGGLSGVISIIQLVLEVLAYCLLFAPSAMNWFRRDPEDG